MKQQVLLFLLFFITIQLHSQNLVVEDWREDISNYQIELSKRHIDPFHNISKVEFDSQVQSILNDVSNKTEWEIIIALMRLTRRIGDGHTAISLGNIKRHIFPFKVAYINKEWRIVSTLKRYEDVLGEKITHINNVEIDRVTKEIGEIAQYVENKHSYLVRTGQYMMLSELLFGLKLTNHLTRTSITFENDSQETKTIQIKALESSVYYKSNFVDITLSSKAIERPENPNHDFLWFTKVKDINGIYIKFEGYPSPQQMDSFGRQVLNYINKNQITKLIIDLRNNGGGDFFIGTRLAFYLNLANTIDWSESVFLLTNNVTFSAGTINAVQFRQILNAKIVGTPTGSNPTGYQDMDSFELPNSKMTVTYSKRLFKFQEKITQGVQPDVLIEYDWESYSKGKDNMMEWIIKNQTKK